MCSQRNIPKTLLHLHKNFPELSESQQLQGITQHIGVQFTNNITESKNSVIWT